MTARQPIFSADGDASATLGSLTAMLGTETLAKLSARFGGRRVYVPARLTAAHELALAVGLDAALLLSAHFAGHTLSVPMPQSATVRRKQVVELEAKGLTRAAIAEKVGLTERRVYQILDEESDAPPNPQGSLF